MIKSFASVLFLLLITACSNNNNAGVVYHERFDFSRVKSYSLYDHNSAFSDTQNLLDTRRNAIEIAIERSMATMQFSYSALEQADLIVTYHVFTGKQGDYSRYNKTVHFCIHCLRATTWRTEQQYGPVSVGSLVLDLVDPKMKRSVWRSIYPLKLEEKENSVKANDKIKHAVATMLAQYPKNSVKSVPSH